MHRLDDDDHWVMDVDRSSLEVLSREESLALLSSTGIGRVRFHAGTLPVAFAQDDHGIVLRVRAGSQLDSATRGAVVTIEAEDVNPDLGKGWSVAVTGVTSDISDPAELVRARALPVDDRAGDATDRVVRISPDLVTGWRGPVVVAPQETDDMEPASGSAGPAAVAETHAGVVFFLGDRAYKLKKPVDLGFLDFRTRQARHDACRREVPLNRRLAPDVYLGVADVYGTDRRLCDHMVVMRRMPGDRRLAALVTSGAPVHDHLTRLAQLLARFHDSAVSSPSVDEAASRDSDSGRWEANATEMAPFSGQPLDPQIAGEAIVLARRFLAGRQPLFERRITERRARDGHGDLLADDIFCLDDGSRVLDCLEFDDRLRFGDVLADVAFLAMDLERLGRPDLATHFLDQYRGASGDSWPASLADHYIAYRAQVRAKVACLRWSQGDTASAEAADRLLRLCHDHLRRARVRLVLVGGGPGTGKSTIARALAAPLGALVVRSDEVRKDLAGLDPLAPSPAGLDQGLYEPSVTDSTYAELLARARAPLGLGQTVVLDATWRDPKWRKAASCLAAETSSDLVELHCVAPIEVAVDRVNRRLAGAADPSDATEHVARMLSASDAPWTTATEVDTSGEAAGAVGAALARVDGPR